METQCSTRKETSNNFMNLEGTPLTLDQWYLIWLKHYKVGHVKPSTLQNYSSIYRNQIKNQIGSMRLCQIHSMHIQQMYNDLSARGISSKYQHCIHAILSNMFDIAMQNDLIVKNPCHNVRTKPLQRKNERFLSIEEHQMLMDILLRQEWDSVSSPIIALLGTGMRIGELLGLTWDNINFQTGHIHIEKTLVYLWDSDIQGYAFSFQSPKTCQSKRSIPMSQTIVKAFMKQKEKVLNLKGDTDKWNPLPGFENLVFPNSHGRPQQRRDIQHLLDRIINTLNQQAATSPQNTSYYIEHIHPHTLRHSFATRCFEAGIQPKVVQTLLGHSSIQVTMDLYTHVSFEKCRKDMEKLQQFGI